MLFVLERETNAEWVTYLDGDLFFFEPPEVIYRELQNAAERRQNAPLTACGAESHPSSVPSHPKNVRTTSETPDTVHDKWKVLYYGPYYPPYSKSIAPSIPSLRKGACRSSSKQVSFRQQLAAAARPVSRLRRLAPRLPEKILQVGFEIAVDRDVGGCLQNALAIPHDGTCLFLNPGYTDRVQLP
jgi:hypothetical protein